MMLNPNQPDSGLSVLQSAEMTPGFVTLDRTRLTVTVSGRIVDLQPMKF